MPSTLQLAFTPGLAPLLMWISLAGIAGLAVVLYVPRRFSGPLTTYERELARRGHRMWSMLLAFATPLLAIGGFALLLPPLVRLDVPSFGAATHVRDVDCNGRRSLQAIVSGQRSTHELTRAVFCRVHEYGRGEQAIEQAIIAAAKDDFSIPSRCMDSPLDFDPWEVTSVEVTLVELMARAHLVTEVEIEAGPRLGDPDPWDVLAATLDSRGIDVRVCDRGNESDESIDVLRLGRAYVEEDVVVADAVIRGDPCGAELPDATVVEAASNREVATSCRLRLADRQESCGRERRTEQSVVRIAAVCIDTHVFAKAETEGLVLHSGFGATPMRTRKPARYRVEGNSSLWEPALTVVRGLDEFVEDLRTDGLSIPERAVDADVVVELDDDKITITHDGRSIGSPRSLSGSAFLDDGAFSWSGFGLQRPHITCEGGRITIHHGDDVLDFKAPVQESRYETTTFLATMRTILWAVHTLAEGPCAPAVGARLKPLTAMPRPLLSARQIDAAVASTRRAGEAVGTLLLSLSILLLATSLRRSVR